MYMLNKVPIATWLMSFLITFSLHGNDDLFVVATLSNRIDIFTVQGLRVVRLEPTHSRITYNNYILDRPTRETIEYRVLPALPWFFSYDGGFFTFTDENVLRYYTSWDIYQEYQVPFKKEDILQVVDHNNLLIRQNNMLAVWQIDLFDFREKFFLPESESILYTAQYIKRPALFVLAYQDRLDYYTSPSTGSVASSINNYIKVLSAKTGKEEHIFIEEGAYPVYSHLEDRVFFFKNKRLYYWEIGDTELHATSLEFNHIPVSVAGAWHAPSIGYLGKDVYLVWYRIIKNKSHLAQLSIFDEKNAKEIDVLQFVGEQGILNVVKNIHFFTN